MTLFSLSAVYKEPSGIQYTHSEYSHYPARFWQGRHKVASWNASEKEHFELGGGGAHL